MRDNGKKATAASGKRAWMLVALAALALALVLPLSGCKYSDVLTEHVEDPVNGVLDEAQDPILRQNPDAPEESDLVSMVVSSSDRIDEQLQDLPQFDSQVPPQDEADNREHDDETPDDANATEGDEASDEEGQNVDVGENDSTTDSETGTSEDQEGEGTGEETQDQEGEGSQDGIADGGSGGTGTAYDATGEFTELPEAGSLAAVGQYATIVQMLAGRGGLRATDAGWVADVRAKGAFPDEEAEGVADVAIAWTGSREEGYVLDVDALIAADPDAVLVDNVDVQLTDEQRSRLEEAKVDMVTVPALGATDTPDADIVAAVAVVGQLLASASTYYDTSAQVTTYNQMHDETLGNCLDANGGYSYKNIGGVSYAGVYQGTSLNGTDTTYFSSTRYTTAFVDSVTHALDPAPVANRQYSDGTLDYLNGQVVDASDGIGLSVRGLSDEFVLLDYYMQVAGVTNNSYDGAKPILSSGGQGAAAIILPGYATGLVPPAMEGLYVTRSSYSALWYKLNENAWLTVGDPSFPGVLARSDEAARAIANSAAKENGIYNVGQPYFVRVVPTGLAGSWADGTVESFLAAPWTFGAFQQGDVAAACDSYADGFYLVFYRVGDASAVVADYDSVYWTGQ